MGDLISDATVAKAGNAPMAIAACFGSPLLTNMLGFGIALTVSTSRTYPEPFLLPPTLRPALYVAWAVLLLNLAFILIAFTCSAYAPPRALAAPLFCAYAAFIATSLSVEAST
jgi:Ca2+/Na+ antiporter